MRIITTIFATLFLGTASLMAQTPEEIVRKMSEQLDRADVEGFTMDLNMKLPILGTIHSHNLVFRDKLKVEASNKTMKKTSWTNATTKWVYAPDTNEIIITAKEVTSTSDGNNLSRFEAIADRYTLKLQKETADAWYIICKKAKANKDKDDPKKMELAVAKDTYLPIYLRAKKSVVAVSIENVTLGVTEESVTFDPAEFPDATIIDKR